MSTHPVPEWLRESDVYVSLANDCGSEGLIELAALPRCELDCGDALRMYRTMGAWCLSWDRVPKAVFCPLWWALTPKKRREAIEEYKYFGEELDEDEWVERMCMRDDVEMFASLPMPCSSQTVTRHGAIRCIWYGYERGNYTSSRLYWDVAEYGQLECLKFLYEYKVPGICV